MVAVAALLFWVLWEGPTEFDLTGSDVSAQSEEERELAEMTGGVPTVEAAEEREREATGPPMVEIEVRGELPDGMVALGPTVRFGFGGQLNSIETPNARGRTVLVVEEGSEGVVEVLWSPSESEKDVLEGRVEVLADEDKVVLVPLRRTQARVVGTITRDGQVAPGLHVKLATGGDDYMARSDDFGRFELLVPDDIDGEISVGGGPGGKVTFGDGHRPEWKQDLQVARGDSEELHVALPRGAFVLQVTDDNDRPRAGAVWVTISPIGRTGEPETIERTEVVDDQGKATFPGLEPGDYWVRMSLFYNRPTPPSRMRVYHPGGWHEERVRLPGLANFRVVALAQEGEEWKPVRVPIWTLDRDGVPADLWDETYWTARSADLETHPDWQRTAAGGLRLRAGDQQYGHADFDLALAEGARDTREVRLVKSGPTIVLEVTGREALDYRTLYLADDAGRLVSWFQLPRASLSNEMIEGAMRIRSDEGAAEETAEMKEVTVQLPAPGRYWLVHVDGQERRRIGRITADEDSTVPTRWEEVR